MANPLAYFFVWPFESEQNIRCFSPVAIMKVPKLKTK